MTKKKKKSKELCSFAEMVTKLDHVTRHWDDWLEKFNEAGFPADYLPLLKHEYALSERSHEIAESVRVRYPKPKESNTPKAKKIIDGWGILLDWLDDMHKIASNSTPSEANFNEVCSIMSRILEGKEISSPVLPRLMTKQMKQILCNKPKIQKVEAYLDEDFWRRLKMFFRHWKRDVMAITASRFCLYD